MRISLEVSGTTLFQLSELNAKEGCSCRSDLELLSDLIRNIVDLSYHAFLAEESQTELNELKKAIGSCHAEAEKVRSRVVPFPNRLQ